MSSQLTDKQQRQVLTHLRRNTHFENEGCSACGNQNFTVLPTLTCSPFLSADDTDAKTSGTPFVHLVCQRCSNTYLLNATRIDLLQLDLETDPA